MAIELSDLRALVRDPGAFVFTNDDLNAAASAAGESVLRAAGIAFQSLAAEYALIGRSVKTDDLAIDTRGRGTDLLAVAKTFFAEAAAADASAAGDVFLVVPTGRQRPTLTRPEGSPWPQPIAPEPVPTPFGLVEDSENPGYWTTP